jgi:hypothetical protein
MALFFDKIQRVVGENTGGFDAFAGGDGGMILRRFKGWDSRCSSQSTGR